MSWTTSAMRLRRLQMATSTSAPAARSTVSERRPRKGTNRSLLCLFVAKALFFFELCGFRAKPIFQFFQLGSEFGPKVFHFEDGTKVDFRVALGTFVIKWNPPCPFNRFVYRLHFPNPIAGDLFACLSEWTIGNDTIAPGKRYSLGLRCRMKPLAFQHDAGVHQLFVELTHFGKQFLARHNAGF